jgi:hypothetical protein
VGLIGRGALGADRGTACKDTVAGICAGADAGAGQAGTDDAVGPTIDQPDAAPAPASDVAESGWGTLRQKIKSNQPRSNQPRSNQPATGELKHGGLELTSNADGRFELGAKLRFTHFEDLPGALAKKKSDLLSLRRNSLSTISI